MSTKKDRVIREIQVLLRREKSDSPQSKRDILSMVPKLAAATFGLLKLAASLFLTAVIVFNWRPIWCFLSEKAQGLSAINIAGAEFRFSEKAKDEALERLKVKSQSDAWPTNWAFAFPQLDAARKRMDKVQPYLAGANVLWVNDFPNEIDPLVKLFEAYGIRVWLALDNANAVALARRVPVDLVVSDIYRNSQTETGNTGLELPNQLEAKRLNLPVVYFVATYDPETQRIPAGARAETTDLPELIHLVCDYLERAYFIRSCVYPEQVHHLSGLSQSTTNQTTP